MSSLLCKGFTTNSAESEHTNGLLVPKGADANLPSIRAQGQQSKCRRHDHVTGPLGPRSGLASRCPDGNEIRQSGDPSPDGDVINLEQAGGTQELST